MKKFFLSLLIMHFIFVAKAQSGDISGRIKDERGSAKIFFILQVTLLG
jgi:hypothetical protein